MPRAKDMISKKQPAEPAAIAAPAQFVEAGPGGMPTAVAEPEASSSVRQTPMGPRPSGFILGGFGTGRNPNEGPGDHPAPVPKTISPSDMVPRILGGSGPEHSSHFPKIID